MYSLIITRTNWRYNFWKLQAQNEHLWCKTITQMLENNTWFSPQRSGLHPINKWSLHNYYITWMQEEYALPWRVRTRHHLGWTFWQSNQRGEDCSLLKILHQGHRKTTLFCRDVSCARQKEKNHVYQKTSAYWKSPEEVECRTASLLILQSIPVWSFNSYRWRWMCWSTAVSVSNWKLDVSFRKY